MFHIETSHLISTTNQMTGFYMERNQMNGFYMKRNAGLKWLKPYFQSTMDHCQKFLTSQTPDTPRVGLELA